jgi:hypothetical protein
VREGLAEPVEAAVHLESDHASFVDGAALLVDGGPRTDARIEPLRGDATP